MTEKLYNVDEVLRLHNEGWYAADIAKEVMCDYVTVKNYLKEFGLKPKKKRLEITQEIIDEIIRLAKEEKKTNKQIAEIIGSNATTVRTILNKNGVETNSLKAKPILKKELVLTQEQLEILYGTLLGDGSIGMQANEARITFCHGHGQEAYFDLKCEKFKGILGKICKEPRYDKRIDKWLDRYSVRTLCHPVFTKLYNELYLNGTKIITREWLNKLTERSLAYWFMDDGSNSGVLCTHCFSYDENKLIQSYFKEKWNIDCKIYEAKEKSGIQYYIFFPKASREELGKLIQPYIIESMSYKIKNWIP